MRHGKKRGKFGRQSQPRRLMVANLACALIERGMIITTLAKAKVTRPVVEKIVTLAKHGTLHDRRLALAKLRQKEVVGKLFKEVAPQFATRNGGYLRITKLGRRSSDAAEMALLEWVGSAQVPVPETPKADKKAKKGSGAPAAEAGKDKEDAATEAKA